MQITRSLKRCNRKTKASIETVRRILHFLLHCHTDPRQALISFLPLAHKSISLFLSPNERGHGSLYTAISIAASDRRAGSLFEDPDTMWWRSGNHGRRWSDQQVSVDFPRLLEEMLLPCFCRFRYGGESLIGT